MKVLWHLLWLAVLAEAWLPSFSRNTRTRSALFAKGVKRGKLGKMVDSSPDRAISSPKKKNKQVQTKPSKRTSSSSKSEAVSPALAEWAASAPPASDAAPTRNNEEEGASEQDDGATAFVPFQQEEEPATAKSARRVKQSVRQQQEVERTEKVQGRLEHLDTLLKEKSGASLQDILQGIRPLLNLQSETMGLRQVTASAKPYYYRLAWVGSDEALCHIGTGLHKVPLARMQEVFLTCQGRNRVELFEVIRVIGPFPNVRNTLQGDSKVKLVRSGQQNLVNWEITMDSMIDGTGKEILAGTENNVRRVKLQVYYADADAIVLVVPPEGDEGNVRDDPFEEDGAHVLLFVREDELDTKLDQLRVL